MSPKTQPTNPWPDRFRKPDVESLFAALPEDAAEPIQHLYDVWSGQSTWKSTIVWRGWGWNWAICFGSGKDSIEAAIIADPETPRAAVKLRSEDLANMHQNNAAKPVRTQMISAKPVGPVVWTEWPVTHAKVLEWLESLSPEDVSSGA